MKRMYVFLCLITVLFYAAACGDDEVTTGTLTVFVTNAASYNGVNIRGFVQITGANVSTDPRLAYGGAIVADGAAQFTMTNSTGGAWTASVGSNFQVTLYMDDDGTPGLSSSDAFCEEDTSSVEITENTEVWTAGNRYTH